MSLIVDYTDVVQQMTNQGLICLYPNSGAFGFPKDVATSAIGWVCGEDPTIRPAARSLTLQIDPPSPERLASLAVEAWSKWLPGPLWLLPKAHWAYELDFGSATWLPALLRELGVGPDLLAVRHDGSALAFDDNEAEAVRRLTTALLSNLRGSDFQLAFPRRDVVCTVHHHQQLWWTSKDVDLIEKLRQLAA